MHRLAVRHSCISTTVFAALVALSATLLVGACNQRPLASQPLDTEFGYFDEFELAPNRNLDLLFVIDNSYSMAAEQRSLVENFHNFVTRLEQIEGGLPNVHIGIVSTDLGVGLGNERSTCDTDGDRGLLLREASPTCQVALPTDMFIRDIGESDGTRTRNYPAGQSLADTFACMAEIGIDGCGYEQPLESMRKALDPSNLSNSGFLREGAYLGVVFITDEDDCSAGDLALFGAEQNEIDVAIPRQSSFRCFQHGVICDGDDPLVPGGKQNCRARSDSEFMTDVTSYVEFLKGLVGDENRIIVAGITGDPEPVEVYRDADGFLDLRKSCGEIEGEQYSGAVPATRLQAFLDQFSYSTSTSLCNEDLSGALDDIGALLATVFDHRCLTGNIGDMDDSLEGVQPNCLVAETRYPDTADPQDTLMPECDNLGDPEASGNQPCYVLEQTAACSEFASQLEVSVYPADRELPPGAELEVHCEGPS